VSPRSLQTVLVYVHFEFCFISIFVWFFPSSSSYSSILNTVCLCTRQAYQTRFCRAVYAYCSYTAQGYSHCLDVSSATTLEPFILSVLSLALGNVVNIYIYYSITAHCYPHSFVTKSYKYVILKATPKSLVGARLGKLPMVQVYLICRRCYFKR
jgi:hypothetical protein